MPAPSIRRVAPLKVSGSGFWKTTCTGVSCPTTAGASSCRARENRDVGEGKIGESAPDASRHPGIRGTRRVPGIRPYRQGELGRVQPDPQFLGHHLPRFFHDSGHRQLQRVLVADVGAVLGVGHRHRHRLLWFGGKGRDTGGDVSNAGNRSGIVTDGTRGVDVSPCPGGTARRCCSCRKGAPDTPV